MHLLGITRCSNMADFASLGVTSFDSTSAFRQAFKDDRDNYHTPDRTYTAIRVPQVDGNPKLKARIQAGRVSQDKAIRLEQACLQALRGYDSGEVDIGHVIDCLDAYEQIFDGRKDYSRGLPRDPGRRTVENMPVRNLRPSRNQCGNIPGIRTEQETRIP